MTDFLEEVAADANKVSGDLLTQIGLLAELQTKLEGELDRAEQGVKDIKAKLNEVSIDKLPDLMEEAKMQEFVLANGDKIEVAEDLYCSVPVARRGEIISKLRAEDMAELITNQVKIDLARGQDNLAGDIMGQAQELGLMAKREETVNTGSLKKYLREQLEEGSDVDLSFFGAHLSRRTKVK